MLLNPILGGLASFEGFDTSDGISGVAVDHEQMIERFVNSVRHFIFLSFVLLSLL